MWWLWLAVAMFVAGVALGIVALGKIAEAIETGETDPVDAVAGWENVRWM